MQRLTKHTGSGAIGMLQAIHQLYSASETVSRLMGQMKIDVGLDNQEWRPYVNIATDDDNIDDICIDDIRLDWLPSAPDA